MLLLTAARPAESYWREECGGPPTAFSMPEHKAIDCKLRSLGYEYAQQVLAQNPYLEMAKPRLHKAFNLSMCGVPPSPPTQRAALSGAEAAAAAQVFAAAGAQLFVAPAGSDSAGDGSKAAPFKTLARAQTAARAAAAGKGGVVVWLRQGTHYQPDGPLTITALDSVSKQAPQTTTPPHHHSNLSPRDITDSSRHQGASAEDPVTWASYPGERATLSGSSASLSGMDWQLVDLATRDALGLRRAGPTIYRATLPKAMLATKFVGLVADGVRLPRARYPNCGDILGPDCYTL